MGALVRQGGPRRELTVRRERRAPKGLASGRRAPRGALLPRVAGRVRVAREARRAARVATGVPATAAVAAPGQAPRAVRCRVKTGPTGRLARRVPILAAARGGTGRVVRRPVAP